MEFPEKQSGGYAQCHSLPKDIEPHCTAALKKLNAAAWDDMDIAETAEEFATLTAELWQIYPFRHGSTRAVLAFAAQFAEAHGFRMDRTILKDRGDYVIDALQMATDARQPDIGHIVKLFRAAIMRG
jgi:fido (protein-threonine AMPylation protein)